MASTVAEIKEFLSKAGCNSAFTSAQLLGFGSRSAVDTAVHRLLRCGMLRRLANGVFMATNATAPIPCATEIARIKASRFAKQIFSDQEKPNKENQHAFLSDGPRTSFMSIYGRITLRQLAPKKQSAAIQTDRQANPVQECKSEEVDQKAVELKHYPCALKKLASKLIDIMKLLVEKGVLSTAEIRALESKL